MDVEEPDNNYDYTFAKIEPDFIEFLPENRREGRLEMDGDLCVFDDEHYFIRGLITLSIRAKKHFFTWLVWVVLSKDTFERIVDSWQTEGRENNPPDIGTLDTRIPGYLDTTGLEVAIVPSRVGQKPSIRIKPCEHRLFSDQENGIDEERAALLEKAAVAKWG